MKKGWSKQKGLALAQQRSTNVSLSVLVANDNKDILEIQDSILLKEI